jgi:hypothetical protein
MCKVENPNSRTGDRFFRMHDWQLAVANGVERQKCTRCGKLNPLGVPPWIRFWDHVKMGAQDECWPWIGRVSHQGYGYFTIMFGKVKKVVSAHRYAYFLNRGEFPVGTTDIDHLCKNRGCNNPLHLEAVTHRVNIQRAKLKDRCKRDHDLTLPDAWYTYAGGRRRCRLCIPIYAAAWKLKQA